MECKKQIYPTLVFLRERSVIGFSVSLIWSKTLMELIFNPCGELLSYWGRSVIGFSVSLIWSKTLMELIFNPCGELLSYWGRSVIGFSVSLIWSKTLMELIFNPCGELLSYWGRSVIGFSVSLIWSKTLMELIFNPCGEVRRAQLAKSILLSSTLVPLGSFKVYSDANEKAGCGKQPYLIIPGKTAALIPKYAVEDLPSTELQSRFLRLQ